ncbi:hypothetical protein TRFO_30716 [Tritrichomonas foetus]|uniref:Protein kinase domain-containing protein n=1 Tax=Tritrichomonas foetus TaxID=1144522 RepID=A0A1J4JY97_9EUKA|nr:hypothetical protein TRFO_30716 [Tritrichomonas foetus]|eukprot:OHT02245.1 hypothetical protein TRFO_30716 [Tritrichomonas foetus]
MSLVVSGLANLSDYCDEVIIHQNQNTTIRLAFEKANPNMKYIFKTFNVSCNSEQQKAFAKMYYDISCEIHQTVLSYKLFSFCDFNHYNASPKPTLGAKCISQITLHKILRKEVQMANNWELKDSLNCLFAVAIGMHKLHSNFKIHGNLCPSNIIVDKAKQCYVSDFGLYKFKSLYYQGSFVSSPYAARDLDPKNPTTKTDIYSYGLLMCRLLSSYFSPNLEHNWGTLIFEGHKDYIYNLCPFLIDIIAKCMDPNPKNRPNFEFVIDKFQDQSFYILKHHISSLFDKFSKIIYIETLANIEDTDAMLLLGELYLKQASETGGNPEKAKELIQKAINLFKKSADLHNTQAQTTYGLILISGVCIQKNLDSGLSYLKESANKGNILGIFHYGNALKNLINENQKNNNQNNIDTQKYEQAEKYLKMAADLGNYEAMIQYGLLVIDIYKNDQDKTYEAVSYFKMAADRNHGNGLYQYGLCLKKGIGTQKDIKEAMHYFQKAMFSDSAESFYEYGKCVLKGKGGLEKNLDEALFYFRKSFEKGYFKAGDKIQKLSEQLTAQNNVLNYQNNNQNDFSNQIIQSFLRNNFQVFKKEFYDKKSMKLIEQENDFIDLKDGKIINEFADIYNHGINVNQDVAKACTYYKLAAELGNSDAQSTYGVLLQEGQFGKSEENMRKGFEMFHLSAQQGNIKGMNNYAMALFNGDGTPKDIPKGLKQLKQVADLGFSEAQLNYGIFLQNNSTPKPYRDKAEGVKYIKMAVDNNEPQALYTYGLCLLKGDGLMKDEERAIEIFEKLAVDENDMKSMKKCIKHFSSKNDMPRAMPFMKLAADCGDIHFMYKYGIELIRGKFVEKNEKLGHEYIKKSGWPPPKDILENSIQPTKSVSSNSNNCNPNSNSNSPHKTISENQQNESNNSSMPTLSVANSAVEYIALVAFNINNTNNKDKKTIDQRDSHEKEISNKSSGNENNNKNIGNEKNEGRILSREVEVEKLFSERKMPLNDVENRRLNKTIIKSVLKRYGYTDPEETQIYEDAVDGSCKSMVEFGDICLKVDQEGNVPSLNGVSVLSIGVHFYRFASDREYPPGMFKYANVLKEGIGIQKNAKKAIEIYKKLDKQFHMPEAQHEIGMLYFYGTGSIMKSRYSAYPFFLKAADGGFVPSMLKVAKFFKKGWKNATHKDPVKQKMYLTMAVEKENNSEANYQLGKMFLKKNPRTAYKYFIEAAKQDHQKANFSLYQMSTSNMDLFSELEQESMKKDETNDGENRLNEINGEKYLIRAAILHFPKAFSEYYQKYGKEFDINHYGDDESYLVGDSNQLIEQGDKFLEDNDNERAKKCYDVAVKAGNALAYFKMAPFIEDPEQKLMYYEYSMKYDIEGSFHKWRECLESIAESICSPNHTSHNSNIGKRLTMGDRSKLMEIAGKFEEKNDPVNASIYYEKAGNVEQAKQLYNYAKLHYQKLDTNIQFALGQLCEKQNENKEALEIYQFAASNDHKEAEECVRRLSRSLIVDLSKSEDTNDTYELGLMYFEGKDNVKPDYKKAVDCFHKAAQHDHAPAAIQLAKCMLEGKGISKNEAGAVQLFEHLLKRDTYPEAQKCLADCLYSGIGTQINQERALTLYKLSAKNGNVDAMFKYGLLNLENKEGILSIKKAADCGNHQAQFEFYRILMKNNPSFNFKNQPDETQNYLKKSVDGNYQPAIEEYGKILLENEPNSSTTIGFLKKLAHKKNLFGLTQYSQILMNNGEIEQARVLMKEAADLGDVNSQYNYAYELFVDDDLKSRKEMINYFKLAADSGHSQAALQYAQFLHEGEIVEKDSNAAAHYCEISLKDDPNNVAVKFLYEKIKKNH